MFTSTKPATRPAWSSVVHSQPKQRVKPVRAAEKLVTTLEQQIQASGGLLVPGCYDSLSARIMARQRYKVRIQASSVCSRAR